MIDDHQRSLRVELYRTALREVGRVLRAGRWASGRELTPEGVSWLMVLLGRIHAELSRE